MFRYARHADPNIHQTWETMIQIQTSLQNSTLYNAVSYSDCINAKAMVKAATTNSP